MKPQSAEGFNSKYLDKKLSSLTGNNYEYERLIVAFYDRIEVALAFIDIQEFINQEIDRVSTSFIKPIVVIPHGIVHNFMNFSEYVSHGYKWLSMGSDYLISQILKNAWQNVLATNPSYSHDQADFNKEIIDNLRRGVAYLMYDKFLKEKRAQYSSSGKDSAEKENASDNILDIIEKFELNERSHFSELIKGFTKMEEYINSNVHIKIKEPLDRTKQLRRNLTNWLHLLRSIYLYPIGEEPMYVFANDLNNKRKSLVKKMELKINGALEILNLRIEDGYNPLDNTDSKTILTQEENADLSSQIEEILSEIKNCFNNDSDFKNAISRIEAFFLKKVIPENKGIFVKGKSKGKLANSLGRIFRSIINSPLTYEYLMFAKDNFTIFQNEKIENNKLNTNNLYKYFTNKSSHLKKKY